jgi:hypothetical protein
MDVSRFAYRFFMRVAMAAVWLNAACAADPGDPLKTIDDGGPGRSADLDAPGGGGGDDADLGTDSSSPAVDTGALVGDDAGDAHADTGQGVTQPEAAAEASVGDGGCNLLNIPASCPDCKTMNASDIPICQKYLMCFSDHGCNPSTACGLNDGICGVNTVGGGEAPYQAAVATYNCACP